MFAGLPGTGIGGIYYLLLVLLLPFRFLARAIRGRARPGEARLVVRGLLFAGAILAALWAQGWALDRAVRAIEEWRGAATFHEAWASNLRAMHTPEFARAAAFASLSSLAGVLVLLHVLRLVVRRTPPALPPPARR